MNRTCFQEVVAAGGRLGWAGLAGERLRWAPGRYSLEGILGSGLLGGSGGGVPGTPLLPLPHPPSVPTCALSRSPTPEPGCSSPWPSWAARVLQSRKLCGPWAQGSDDQAATAAAAGPPPPTHYPTPRPQLLGSGSTRRTQQARCPPPAQAIQGKRTPGRKG